MASTTSSSPSYLLDALEDAETLLKYASETGVVVDAAVRQGVLGARDVSNTAWTPDVADKLLLSLSTLADRLKPVTAESLKACSHATRKTVQRYTLIGSILVCLIVPASCISFVASDVTMSIKSDIATANDLAVKLRAQLGSPADRDSQSRPATLRAADTPPARVQPAVFASPAGKAASDLPGPAPSPVPHSADALVITQLQQYAATVREIDARANKLAVYVFWNRDRDPFSAARTDPELAQKRFELPEGLPDFSAAAAQVTDTYQQVRYRAQNLGYTASLWTGAMTACVLPILYALLGTCAYLARKFEDGLTLRTFVVRGDDWIRFLVAAIAGLVVGLFGTFGQGASVSPLAVAFLAGYGVEAFFVFLDNIVQSFAKGGSRPALAKS